MNLETMRLLVAKGLSAEDILEIAETLDAPPTPPVRSSGAERQARYRARKAASDVICDVTDNVTRDGDSVTPQPFPASPNDNILTPTTHTQETQPRARKADVFPVPDWADAAVWADFLKNRKTKRLTNTATAHAALMREMDKLVIALGEPPGDILRECVSRGWGRFVNYVESDNGGSQRARENRNVRRGGAAGVGPVDNRDGFQRACDRRLAEAGRSADGGDEGGGSAASSDHSGLRGSAFQSGHAVVEHIAAPRG